VRGVVRKIDGVRDVNVSLKQGLATIHFNPSNRVKVAQIWKAVRDNGFTPRASTVRALGVINVRADTVVLTLADSEDSFVLEDAPDHVGRVAELRRLEPNRPVEVTGQLAEAPERPGNGPIALRVQSFVAR
jgi:copper chaperone CopZ